MTKIKKSALVMHSAHQMFDLVNDVNAYSTFLPWCESTHIVSQTESEMVASLTLAKGGIRHTFTTRNTLVVGQSLSIELVEGPFKTLNGFWVFTALQDKASKVELELDFEFSTRMLEVVLNPIFKQIANTLVDSFCKRADQVYGR